MDLAGIHVDVLYPADVLVLHLNIPVFHKDTIIKMPCVRNFIFLDIAVILCVHLRCKLCLSFSKQPHLLLLVKNMLALISVKFAEISGTQSTQAQRKYMFM